MSLRTTARRPVILAILALIVILAIATVLLGPAYQGSPSKASASSSTVTGSSSYVSMLSTIPLPSTTQGRIDHMSVDLNRGLLFVAAYGNNTVGIVDIRSGLFLRSISGFSNPQGVAWIPDAGKLFVSNAGDGTVDIFDGSSFAVSGKISLAGDADNLRYDGATKLLYVGYGSGGIAAVNLSSNSVVTTRALPAHPESFQVEVNGRAVYVNVPPSNLIVAFDKVTGRSITNRSMTGNNFPMALDESGGRLLVATRGPAELRILDTSTPSLRSVANVTIPGDPDDVFLDSARGLIYVSCGQGFVAVVKQTDPGHYSLVQTIATGSGARTSLFVPELGRIFVAQPAGTGQQAAILVFGTGVVSSSSSSSISTSSSRSITSTAPIPTAASLSISPSSGPSGLLVTLSGSGYVPGAAYQVCVGAFANSSCGFEFTSADYLTTIDEFAIMGSFTADSSGNIPAGTRMAIPDLFGRSFSIGVGSVGGYSFFVSSPFTVVAPTVSINAVAAPAGATVTLSGSGYAPSTTYTVCMVPAGTVDCGYSGDREETPPGWYLGNFTADQSGKVPAGFRVALARLPPGDYAVGVFIPRGGYILISEVRFTLTGAP